MHAQTLKKFEEKKRVADRKKSGPDCIVRATSTFFILSARVDNEKNHAPCGDGFSFKDDPGKFATRTES